MTDADHDDHAARIERRTDHILKISGLMFLAWQASYFAVFNQADYQLRTVDVIARAAYVAWACALLMLVATGGGLFRSAAVRAILDDELARSHRADAYRNAFWSLIVIALAAYAATQLVEMSAHLLAHIMLSAGVLVAVATLAFLRRR